MKKLTYKITLLEPLYARALGGEPNSGVSLPYVPGGLVRTALLLKHTSQFDAADDEVRRLFLNGTTKFCNAFPVFGGQPVAPTPRSWQQEKGKHGCGYDFLPGEPDRETASNCRAVKKPFYAKDGNEITFVSPERALAVHNRRHRDFGRPVERETLNKLKNRDPEDDDPGIIFRYEALAPRQIFQGEIFCQPDDLETFEKLLEDLRDHEIHLGGSRSGGYGRAKIEKTGVSDFKTDSLPENGDLTVIFLSDTLLRDNSGQYSASSETILKHFGDKLDGTVTLTCEKAFLAQNIVGGFNRKWGLPLPQCVAVAMGGVLKIKIEKGTTDTAKKLAALALSGIGERRAEGFGRIKIDVWNTANEKLTVKEMNGAPQKQSTSTTTSLNGGAKTIAKRMLERHFRNQMEARLPSLTPEVRAGGLSGSQIARMRNVVQRQLAAKAPDFRKITEFIKKMESRQRIRNKFDGAKPSLDWFRKKLAIVEKSGWEKIFGDKKSRFASLGSLLYDPADNKALRDEFLLRYLDLTLAKLAKAAQKTQNAQQQTGGAA